MSVRQGVLVGCGAVVCVFAVVTVSAYRVINQAIEGAWR